MKKYIVGFVAGIAVMATATGYAEDGYKKIEAYLNGGVQITLDGKKVKLDNPAIMYDESNYIRLRDVSKIAGVDVNWNEATGTVELKSKTETNSNQDISTVADQTPSNNETITKTKTNGLNAIILNNVTYVNLKEFADKIYLEDTRNVLSYDEENTSYTLYYNSSISEIPFNKENFYYIGGTAYLNIKFIPI